MAIHVSSELKVGTATRQLYFRDHRSDEVVIKQVLVEQQYDLGRLKRARELLDFIQREEATGLRPLIVDAGANIGASAIFFTANFPNALVVAIEPNLENFDLLSKNVKGLNVEMVHGAISSNAGRSRVCDPGMGHLGYRTQAVGDEDAGLDTVPHLTINDIFKSHPSPFFPIIVKVDIEGAEIDLFSGNTEWVARTPILIVELHDWLIPKGGTSRPFLQCISKLNRDFVHIGEHVFSIANDLDVSWQQNDDDAKQKDETSK